MADPSMAAPHARMQTKKATASGWIGSALEYYDFFIYLSASSIVFPQLFFPKGNDTVAIILSLAFWAVGYVARPIGAFVLGHLGDTIGRKNVLLICMFVMGFSTVGVGLLPTFEQVGILAPFLLVSLRIIQGFAVAGEISGSSCMILEHAPFGRRGYFASFTLQGVQAGQILAAAVFIPLARFMPQDAFMSYGWRIPFLLSVVVIIVGFIIRREVDETPAFTEEESQGAVAHAPIPEAFRTAWPDMLRVVLMSLMNVIPTVTVAFGTAYAVQPSYGVGFPADVSLWIPVLGNVVAVLVIPFVGALSDRIGRRIPIVVGAVLSGAMSYGYLWAISTHNIVLAFAFSALMWGVIYQGYNAVFPSFYPELFATRVRVTAMAIAQNVGTTITAFLPAIFTAIAPPGSANIPVTIGSIAFGISIIAALAAWSARETSRVRVADLGRRDAMPMPKDDYDRLRAQAA